MSAAPTVTPPVTRPSRKRMTPRAAGDEARAAAQDRADRALELLISDERERSLYADAVARYVDAVALGATLRQQWFDLGEPMTTEGSMRQPIPHPLVKMIADADAAAARYSKSIGLDPAAKKRPAAPGRPIGAVSAPDRRSNEPPRVTRLQAVK